MNDITGSINATIPMITASMTGKSHANLAHIHLNSARIFTDLALAIDQHYKNQAPQNVINSYMSYVSSSIICSVSALEAKINQFLVDHKAEFDDVKVEKNSAIFKHYSTIFDHEAPLLNKLHGSTNALIKYNVIFYLRKGKFLPYNKLFKGTNFAINVRNALIHFTPEWDNELKLNKKLEGSYFSHFSNDFDLSQFYCKDEIFIPYRCLSASHAEWVYKNSNAFMKKFFSSISSG